ncbi:MAG TPA: hypothetical protein DCM40_37555, partial [Maribacter sp.]|nr:hypothetical protein [Maribacter sp.]
MDKIQVGFTGSNVYDVLSNRQSNLEFNLNTGVTVEFWLRKEAFDTSNNTEREVIFDLWNGQVSSSADYGRLRIELAGTPTNSNPFLITAMSGTSGFATSSIGDGLTQSSVKDWNHYAFSFINGNNDVTASLYVNGDLNQVSQFGNSPLSEVTGGLKAHIGSLITAPSASKHSDYSGVISAG